MTKAPSSFMKISSSFLFLLLKTRNCMTCSIQPISMKFFKKNSMNYSSFDFLREIEETEKG